MVFILFSVHKADPPDFLALFCIFCAVAIERAQIISFENKNLLGTISEAYPPNLVQPSHPLPALPQIVSARPSVHPSQNIYK